MPVMRYSHMMDADAFKTLSSIAINVALSGGNVIVSGIAGKLIDLYRILVVVGGATNLTFYDGPTSALSGPIPLLANGSLTLDLSNVPWYQTTAGKDLILNSSNAVQISGTAWYTQQ